ncbi:flavoprotein [Arthrobacter sp. zg-Y820]|uniref:flavoprotein n=1 Tax=Arthrobacter sp. zg-Y820 TaxID=2894192 RepID=UPI003FA4527D
MKNVLVIVTGASSAMFTPYNLNWAKIAFPKFNIRVMVTESAQQFVTTAAVQQLLTPGSVFSDSWLDATESFHVELAIWADGIVVSPATFNYVNSYVSGLADRPSQLCLHACKGPKVFTPSFPPGIDPEPWLTKLRSMPDTVVAPFVPALSSGTKQVERTGSAPLMNGLQLLKERLTS